MDLLQFRDLHVRNLAWAVASPPLWQPTVQAADCLIQSDRHWYRQRYNQIKPQLQALDKDPSRLHEHLAALKDHRLGVYFEALWRFYFTLDPSLDCLRSNEQLLHPDTGHTHGEMDFIIHESERSKTSHWEVAVKFYLGAGDTQHMNHWFGPGLRDRLDKKCHRMQAHQIQLSQQDWVRRHLNDQSIQIDDARIIMKGRLFYPHGSRNKAPAESLTGHLKGFWCSANELLQHISAQSRVATLHKRQWLAPVSAHQFIESEMIPAQRLHQQLRTKPLNRPICVAVLDGDDEKTRGFIVPDDWLHHAITSNE